MAENHIHEIIINKDGHQLLVQDAKIYELANKDTLTAFEAYITEEYRETLLQHMNDADGEWFVGVFINEPKHHYLIQVLPVPDQPDKLHMTLICAENMICEYQDMIFALGSQKALLGLFEDMFFEYRPDTDKVRLFNAEKTVFRDGSHPFDEVADYLRYKITPENKLALDTLIRHIKGKTPSFQVTFSQNLLNEDPAITDTTFRGIVAHHVGQKETVVGQIHPLRQRGTGTASTFSYDPLTGLVNKNDITQLATDRIDSRCIANTTLAIVDIDYFKNVNDSHGHQFGDIVLKEVAAIMKTEVGEDGVCGRIGGDEFLILFNNNVNEEILRSHLRNIKSLVKNKFPDKGPRGEVPITLSMGTATYPDHAKNYNDLFMVADYCLYMAKEKGRNRYVLYTPEKHPSLEMIRNSKTEGENLVNGRDDLPLGDALVQMLFMIRFGKRPSLNSLLPEFAERFGIPLLMLVAEDPIRPLLITGRQEEESARTLSELEVIMHPMMVKTHLYKYDMVVCNNIIHLPAEVRPMASKRLQDADIHSFVVAPFEDVRGRKASLVFISLHQNLVWNESHYMYYKLFLDALATYDLGSYFDV